jgi:hypothetical protein
VDKGATAGRGSGWPEVPPAPARPAPKASLTDVVPRRTLVITAVVVVLAIIGTVLALTLGGGDGGPEDSKGGDAKSSSGGTAAGSGDKDKGSGAGADGDDKKPSSGASDGSAGDGTAGSSPSASASGDSDDETKSDDDTAVQTYRSGQGFSIGLPKGWKYQSTGAAGSRFTGPDGQKLLVGWTSTPKDDPVADWKNQERYMTRPQYQRIRIEKVGYRGWNAADWEFTYVESGTKYRSVDRGFVVNSHQGYGLMYTAKDADWGSDLRKDTWHTLTRTFKPKS